MKRILKHMVLSFESVDRWNMILSTGFGHVQTPIFVPSLWIECSAWLREIKTIHALLCGRQEMKADLAIILLIFSDGRSKEIQAD